VVGAAEITADLMQSLFETNVFGVVRVTHAFCRCCGSRPPRSWSRQYGLASLTRVTTPGRITMSIV